MIKKILLLLFLAVPLSAATLVQYIDTDVVGGTGDGSSWANAYAHGSNWAAQNLNLTDNGGDTLTVYARGKTADTPYSISDSWTQSTTNFITLIGDRISVQSDLLSVNTAYYRIVLTATDGYQNGLSINDPYTRVRNIQIDVTNTSYDDSRAIYLTADNIVIRDCILKGTLSGTATGRGIYATNTTYLFNNVIYGFKNGTSWCQGVYAGGGAGAWYSNTVYNCHRGLFSDGAPLLKNNICVYNNADFSAGSNAGNSNNLSSDSSAPGANSVITSPSYNLFVSTATNSENFHLLAGCAAVNAGVDTSGDAAPMNFTTDIDDNTRSNTWDIGTDEYQTTSTPAAIRRRIVVIQ